MHDINAFVKWICGMGLVLIALIILAEFVIDYQRAQQSIAVSNR